MEGAERQPVRHLVRAAVGVPLNVSCIDPDQAVHQAQGEAADAALGEVGLQHRRLEPGSSPAVADWGTELKPDRLQDLLVEAGAKCRSSRWRAATSTISGSC